MVCKKSMPVSRKSFFKGLAVGTLSLPLILKTLQNGNAQQDNDPLIKSSKRYKWKMVTTWPPNFPILGEACEAFAEMVNRMSGGRMEIRVFGAGELVPALETFDTVRNGGAELGNGAAYYWAGKIPAAQFFATVPFGMNAQQVNTWITSGGGQALWEACYRDFNLVPMMAGNTGVQMGGWFNREINSITDFQGLKMRIPGLAGKVLEKAGGAPVLLAGGEIYTGLERGVLDATEWLGPFHDYTMGFHEIAKYYYSPGWHEPGTVLELIANKEKFDSLPEDLQAIIRAAAAYFNAWVFNRMEAANAEYLQIMIEKGIDIRKFPVEVLDTLRTYTQEVIEEMTQADAFTKKVYESYSAFRKKAVDWAEYSEKVFYDNLQLS